MLTWQLIIPTGEASYMFTLNCWKTLYSRFFHLHSQTQLRKEQAVILGKVFRLRHTKG
jgi:hypothetical protein